MKKNYLLILKTSVLLFVLVGCGSTRIRNSKSESAKSAKMKLPAADISPRQKVPQASADSLFVNGTKHYQAKDYLKAFDFFAAALRSYEAQQKTDSNTVALVNKERESRLYLLRSATQLGRWSESLSLSESLLASSELQGQKRSETYQLRVRALEATGDHLLLLSTLTEIRRNPSLQQEHEPSRLKSIAAIENQLYQGELETFLEKSDDPELKATASNRLAEIALNNKDVDQARSYFKQVISLVPNTERAHNAENYLQQLDSLSKVESKTIGVILPLSGKHPQVAQKTLRGLQMGLGLTSNLRSSFKLAVIDDESNSDRASRGVDRLVKEDNVIAIVGSLLSKTAGSIASKSSEYGVPNINLSQKSGVTELGPTIFRNALTSEMQVRELVRYSIEEKGMQKFAILYPNDPYGVEYANLFWDEVRARGGQITSVQSYSTKETDFRYVVQRLVGTYYTDARIDEYKVRLKDWSDNNKKTLHNQPPETLLPPIIDFDAIFIPDSAKALGQISAMLSFNDIRGIKLLGTNLWNTPGLAKRAGNWSSSLIFVDSFVATDQAFQNLNFVRQYKALFNEEPGPFEIQAYDTGLILRQLIIQGASSRQSLAEALSRAQNIPSANGVLSISSDREFERPISVLGLSNGQISTISPNSSIK